MIGIQIAAFVDPVAASQRHFRSMLSAMSDPGQPIPIEGELPGALDGGLSPARAAILLSLADFETPIWIDPLVDGAAEVSAWLRFHCGCPVTTTPDKATFAVLAGPDGAAPLARFAQGSDEFPDRSTTILIEVEGFGAGAAARLAGPGIVGSRTLQVAGATASFWLELGANNRRFPRGVDLLLVAGRTLVGLPRSTQIEPL